MLCEWQNRAWPEVLVIFRLHNEMYMIALHGVVDDPSNPGGWHSQRERERWFEKLWRCASSKHASSFAW